MPSLVPVLTGALASSAGALLLLGWHGRPLAGAFVIAAAALGIVPLALLFSMAAAGATPGPRRATPRRRRVPAAVVTLEHASYIGGLDDTGLGAIVDAWTDTDAWVGPAGERIAVARLPAAMPPLRLDPVARVHQGSLRRT